ncbi:MAG: hypothetical protein LPK06_05280 [Marinobacter sp.]|nr:hypothetical protein [Marinobacter sp.]MDX5334802.1 hypothetical protein [Marinobacter sp.]MDX5471070.1 hypothetical protein [Marinobacter sp.]
MQNRFKLSLVTGLSGLLMAFGAQAFDASNSYAGMAPLEDDYLAEVTGQSLIVSNVLAGTAANPTVPAGSGSPSPHAGAEHTFYRMALNARVEQNMNIDRLQLGCGGFNETVVANACDIDLEYVRLQGLNPDGSPGDPVSSLFLMERPYLDLAIRGDNTVTGRELIGIKIGAETVRGYLSIGHVYQPGEVAGCTGSEHGDGALQCRRGINRISGYLKTRLQGTAYGCFALFGTCNPGPPEQQAQAAFFNTDIVQWGTRLHRAQAEIAATTAPGFLPLGLTLDIDALVNTHLRMIHGLAQDPDSVDAQGNRPYDADDFFLSFQREAVRWPTYNKTQTHSFTANPGWWMNAPYAELTGLRTYGLSANLGSAFAATALVDPDTRQVPADNCYGALVFC